jgi:hypothetical protein
MTAVVSAFDRIRQAYRAMAVEANYRPSAPSDGFGNITVPMERLDLEVEAAAYAERFQADEHHSGEFFIGCTNYPTNRATVYAIEAARDLCGGGVALARRLLEMALAELDSDEAKRAERIEEQLEWG